MVLYFGWNLKSSYIFFQVVLPGLTRDVFLAVREFLYTGDCPSAATLNCLGIIEAADRLCLPRLIRLVEAAVVDDLTVADKDGEDIIEDVLKLLEPTQVSICNQLETLGQTAQTNTRSCYDDVHLSVSSSVNDIRLNMNELRFWLMVLV